MVANRRVVAILQCRMTSTRLPGKALLDLCGKTLLARVVERTQAAQTLDDIWVATSTDSTDDIIVRAVNELDAKVFRGPLDNVLGRYRDAARAAHADVVVRITCDNPLIEPRFIDLCVEKLLADNLDHVVVTPVPLGTGSEAISRAALNAAAEKAVEEYDREHVTPFIVQRPEQFKLGQVTNPFPATIHSDLRLTLDTPDDHARLSDILSQFPGTMQPSLEDVIALHRSV